MCGICGIVEYRTGHEVVPERLHAMNATLRHRGPDDEGYYSVPGVGLAMCRLSIIDVSGGHQPISNEDGSVWVVFNGEIYNYQSLRDELLRKGHHLKTRSDTEVIPHLYEEYGADCVEHLEGMFAFALYDQRQVIDSRDSNDFGRLLLARDRTGKKPLYYADTGQTFIFGSELKAVLHDPRVGRTLDQQALHDYLSMGMIPSEMSIYKQVRKLLPGHTLLITQKGASSPRPYWKWPRENSNGFGGDENVAADMKRILVRSVEKRLESEVPIGAFLSGGLDSSLVTAIMSRLLARKVDTFSIGFEGPETHNELPQARLAAQHLGTRHHEILARPDIVQLLPEIIEATDEPFAISSAIPLLLLSRAARQEVTVVLTGDGGDEVFGGYGHYLYERWARLAQHFSPHVMSLVGVAAGALPGPVTHPIGAMRKRIRHLTTNLTGSAAERRLGWSSWFNESEKDRLYASPYRDEIRRNGIVPTSARLQSLLSGISADPAADANFLDAVVWLPEEMLAKVDRMTMNASIEARCPMLDTELIAYSAKLPFSLKIPGSRDRDLKTILRNMAREFLPEKLTERRKQGFNVPLDFWFRGPARAYLEHYLCRERIERRGIFNPDTVAEMLTAHQTGKANMGNRLFGLLTFEIWAENER